MSGICVTCAYYHMTETHGAECRRYPPIKAFSATKDQSGVGSHWAIFFPEVRAHEWCGEYRARSEGERDAQG